MDGRRSFTKEFKLEALRMAKESGNLSATARNLGVGINLLRRWRGQLETDGERAFPGHGNPQDEEMYRLERENRRLKEENEILKKAVGIFSIRPH